MKIKEYLKNCKNNGQDWSKRHPVFIRVFLIVLTLIFTSLIIYNVRSCGRENSSEVITANAESVQVNPQGEGYYFATDYCPLIWVDWANYGFTATLCYAPLIAFMPAGVYVHCGGTTGVLISYSSVDSDTGTTSPFYEINVPFYRTVDSQGNPVAPVYDSDFYLSVRCGYLDNNNAYDKFYSGDWSFERMVFYNAITPGSNYVNQFRYTIFYHDNVNDLALGFDVEFIRREVDTNYPLNLPYIRLTSGTPDPGWTQIRFPYLLTYNGVNVESESYQAGYLAGSSISYSDGYEAGSTAGYSQGYNVGLNEGYQNALSDSDSSPFEVAVAWINNLMTINILPGVKLSLVLIVGFGLVLLKLFMKIVFHS